MPKIYNAGLMDRYLTMRYPVPTRGTAGGNQVTWATHTESSWGQWLPADSKEVITAEAKYSDLSGVVRIRWRTDIRNTWRFLMDGDLFELLGPPMEGGRYEFQDLPVRRISASESQVATYQTFEVALAEGDIEKAITFPVAFTGTPRGIYCQLVMPANGYTFTIAVRDLTQTANGFTVDFGASVPGAGYSLSIQAAL